MKLAKDTARATVRIGYDGRVHKTFRAKGAEQRYANEVRVLRYLEERGCPFVPRLIEADPEELRIVTTNCGARVEQLSDQKLKDLFDELESYGVRHDDPYLRNVTYRATDGRFCLIDFEFATILDASDPESSVTHRDSESDPSASDSSVGSPSETASGLEALRWSAVTDRGRFRPNNEDSFLAIAFDQGDFTYLGREGVARIIGQDFIFAVSDGMGGEKSGEFASRFTVDNIIHLMPRLFQVSPAHYGAEIPQWLKFLFQRLHMQLTTLGQSYDEGHNMGATLTLVWYCEGWFHFGHIGDSRIYRLPHEGGIEQVTDDHTHVGWLQRQGKLNEREARSHPRRNMLSQSLGSGNRYVEPQVGRVRCEPGDRFLLCTDGINDGLWDRGIDELIRDPPASKRSMNPAERLVDEAVSASGRDNTTALVIEILDAFPTATDD